ncbi:MAG: PepSY-associated TM helix domain-containing protein [Bacteroidota bacterium]
MKDSKQKSVNRLRRYRVYHKYIGIVLAILLFISAVTGFFLGWKKNVDLLQPPTQKGQSKDMQAWKSVDDLATFAVNGLYEAYPTQEGNEIDRMDFRPSKGIVKVLFKDHWWEVQLDCTSGEVLSVAKRHSDWIEKLHDGSLISDTFKLVSMNVLGLGLCLMIITGLWLWYGPKVIRRLKKR